MTEEKIARMLADRFDSGMQKVDRNRPLARWEDLPRYIQGGFLAVARSYMRKGRGCRKRTQATLRQL